MRLLLLDKWRYKLPNVTRNYILHLYKMLPFWNSEREKNYRLIIGVIFEMVSIDGNLVPFTLVR